MWGRDGVGAWKHHGDCRITLWRVVADSSPCLSAFLIEWKTPCFSDSVDSVAVPGSLVIFEGKSQISSTFIFVLIL